MEKLTTPVEIQFSRHCLLKIELLKSHGFALATEIMESIIRFPDKTDKSYKGRSIAQKGWDDTHVVRVVYERSAPPAGNVQSSRSLVTLGSMMTSSRSKSNLNLHFCIVVAPMMSLSERPGITINSSEKR